MAIAWKSDDRGDAGTSRPGVLPTPLTSFVGRTQARTDVADLLDRHRLVTLTGPGGCGKTRLALEVAIELAARDRGDGVFVDVAPVESGALVVNSFAAACGVSETGTVPLAELIVQSLGERQVLVLLDNCEHVVDECATLVHQLLTRCAGIAVLATSREPLAVDGEITYRVPPLTVPEDGDDPEATLQRSESGQLFVDRAGLARPGYRFTEHDAHAAIRVCRRLDGIPLALELAASRLRVIDVSALAAALADHFAVLGEGTRTAPPRQRTLEASIDWSHMLLDDRERRVFRRLGVFAGSFSAESAAAVCAGMDDPAGGVAPVLVELVDQSLVQIEDSPAAARYRLLDTVREYARHRLADAGEDHATRDRHLDHHLEIARFFADEPGQPSTTDGALARIDVALDDLRSAIEWSIRSDDVGKGLRIAADLRAFWVGRSRTAEGRAHLAGLLDVDTGGDMQTRAAALVVAAQLADYAADPASMRELAAEALELSRATGDRALEGQALTMLGWAAVFTDPVAARSLLTDGLDELKRAGHERMIEFGEMGLGVALVNRGDLTGAASTFSDAVERARARDTWGVPFGLGMLGYVNTLRGAFEEADVLLSEAVARRRGAYERFNEDLSRQWLALLRTFQGDYELAARIHDDGLARAEERGTLPIVTLLHGALLDAAQGNCDRATTRAMTVLPAVQHMGWRWFEVQALRVLGDAACRSGDDETAEARCRAAAAAAEASANPVAQAVAALGLAGRAEAGGDAARARSLVRQALRYAVGADYRIGAIDAVELGAIVAVEGDRSPKGTAEEMAKILAAVAAERARTGYTRFPVDLPGFDGAVGLVRDALGAGFESAWAEGSALGFDDAVALASRGERRPPRPPTGWTSLTPAEQRVARMVADGLTNPEIGERLFISARTVQTHLSRVFTKLGISGRAELAAAVCRREAPADTAG